MTKPFSITRVVSRNFLRDIQATAQNILGRNLTPYEKMANQGFEQCFQELKNRKIIWWRSQVTQLDNGALTIVIYGVEK